MPDPDKASPPRTVRRRESGRLAYYRTAADPAMWARHWEETFRPETYDLARQGHLGALERPFLQWLPHEGRVLEAGCGLGQIVLALRARGFDCEGIEWSAETVEQVQRRLPDLPIRAGDVTRIDVPDGHFRAHISLGVVEHRREGPEPFLREAHRVLAPDGVLLLSVPHFHWLRRAKAWLTMRGKPPVALPFYQMGIHEA